jgi:hypothetical protein
MKYQPCEFNILNEFISDFVFHIKGGAKPGINLHMIKNDYYVDVTNLNYGNLPRKRLQGGFAARYQN